MHENFVHHNQGLDWGGLRKTEVLYTEAEKPRAVAGDSNRLNLGKFN